VHCGAAGDFVGGADGAVWRLALGCDGACACDLAWIAPCGAVRALDVAGRRMVVATSVGGVTALQLVAGGDWDETAHVRAASAAAQHHLHALSPPPRDLHPP